MKNVLLLHQVDLGDPSRKAMKKQPLTRSLLSRSEKPRSSGLDSYGASGWSAPSSTPYLLCSAVDAASVAIDYSKGDVEEGVVNSLPSRGRSKSRTCSPSPLKLTSSTRGGSLSPTSCAHGGTSRKLELLDGNEADHLRVDDIAALVEDAPSLQDPAPTLSASTVDHRQIFPDRTVSPRHLPRLEDNQPRRTMSIGTRRLPSSDSLFRQRVLRDH